MNKPKRVLLGALSLVILIWIAVAGYNWYYRRYLWPLNIQRQVIGLDILNGSSLISRTGYSHYGEGLFRWKFKLTNSSNALLRLCGKQPISACKFVKTHHVTDGVDQTVSYADGILTLEEVWS